jgi:alpha-1,2-glucosyltransferase
MKGDKENHQAVLHYPQILYFYAFSSFFGLISFLKGDTIISFLNFISRHYFITVGIMALFVFWIKNYTYGFRNLELRTHFCWQIIGIILFMSGDIS